MAESYVLVIDDDETTLSIVRTALQRNYIQVTTATDGQQGLDIINIAHPQAILLDIGMPKMNGNQVLRLLKLNKKTRSIPVIMLTSEDDITAVSKYLEQGAKDYIVKPFDLDNLILRVRKHMLQD